MWAGLNVHMRCRRARFWTRTLLVKMSLSGLSLKQDRYVSLLDKLIGESEFLQDNPPKFVPQENRYSCFMKVMQLVTG